MSQSYSDLEIYQQSYDLFLATHRFSMQLPKHEKYELGSQVRRSADSVNSNIVEGYGRRRYKREFIRYLVFSQASNDETINHLKKVGDLYPQFAQEAGILEQRYIILGKQLNRFIQYVIQHWKTQPTSP
ncbi:four helix bundle protein [Neolewinella marina]|uniref:Four helix bundle protein n=1 Tax=Neolewinella marina TaxID=438751 RepID=A0A2G0CAM0_9BACT|nr:four helix bundle protein [Neolewinella marina]PHK97040.1 four helix bundle protein [Neolewinella marina]